MVRRVVPFTQGTGSHRSLNGTSERQNAVNRSRTASFVEAVTRVFGAYDVDTQPDIRGGSGRVGR